MLKTVVLLLDGSTTTGLAIEIARGLCRRHNAVLRLVSLVDCGTGNGRRPVLARRNNTSQFAERVSQHERHLREVGSRFHNLPVQIEVRNGSPADEIASIAAENPDAIFVVPHDVAYRIPGLLRGSPLPGVSGDGTDASLPVLLVGADERPARLASIRHDRMLIVIDSPLDCERMIGDALGLLGNPDSHIHVLWALRPPQWSSRSLNRALVLENLQFLHERGAEFIERALNRAAADGYTVSWSHSADRPIAAQVARAAETTRADLIVLPSTLGAGHLSREPVVPDLVRASGGSVLLLDPDARESEPERARRPARAATPGGPPLRRSKPPGSGDEADSPSSARLAGRIRED